ncbi:unnamed protein product [Caenorhabditis auriculariae]|uniref:Uncharacterized protein n=1 Tax=Caenorhabditis auriculariae TaxID=2777116 RepID=A0A8S1H559_9PELO|nr:unnamed protein product [Caenorhabditis auriculariae]
MSPCLPSGPPMNAVPPSLSARRPLSRLTAAAADRRLEGRRPSIRPPLIGQAGALSFHLHCFSPFRKPKSTNQTNQLQDEYVKSLGKFQILKFPRNDFD